VPLDDQLLGDPLLADRGRLPKQSRQRYLPGGAPGQTAEILQLHSRGRHPLPQPFLRLPPFMRTPLRRAAAAAIRESLNRRAVEEEAFDRRGTRWGDKKLVTLLRE
jgi:hypothetical protein